MYIEVGTKKYKDLFGFRDFLNDPFESRLPPHKLLVQSLADPSKRIDVIDQIIGDARPEGLLHTAGLKDLHLGSQYMMHARLAVSRLGDTLSLPGNGLMTSMTEGLVDVMRQVKIPSRASNEDVQRFLADAAFAIGMKALGAFGPWGKIAAAVAGFARGIVQIIRQRKDLATMDEDRRRKLAYAKLPPLQEPDTQVDAWYVDAVLKAKMETGSWSAIFSPRFDSDEWVAITRNGGVALAPGEELDGVDELGDSRKVFKAAGGIGFMPGLDQITSVIQVGVDPEKLSAWDGGTWPVRPETVTDVGKFFVNTGRLAAIAWSWATEADASPDLYKIDTKVLHQRWKRYCDGGLRFLQENARDWEENNGKGRVLSGTAGYIAGSAIGCAIGVWRCWPEGNGFSLLEPGVRGDAMMGYGRGRESIGCVMDPPSMGSHADGKSCFFTVYELRIRKVLDEARRRQKYFLWHSLVSAYVRADFDAFLDPKMRDTLMRARALLLEHPDRMLVELNDVADDEPGLPGDGKTWKQQLIARGVRKRHPLMYSGTRTTGGRQPGTLKPPTKPPPKLPLYEGKLAWADVPELDEDRSQRGWKTAAKVAGGLLLGGGAYALARQMEKG